MEEWRNGTRHHAEEERDKGRVKNLILHLLCEDFTHSPTVACSRHVYVDVFFLDTVFGFRDCPYL
jgi:hypothetical protein